MKVVQSLYEIRTKLYESCVKVVSKSLSVNRFVLEKKFDTTLTQLFIFAMLRHYTTNTTIFLKESEVVMLYSNIRLFSKNIVVLVV